MSVRISTNKSQRVITLVGCCIFALSLIGLATQYNYHWVLLFTIAAVLGVTLYHASFGFAGAYRAFILRRDTQGINAQLLMLAVGSILFAPLLAQGTAFGQPIGGAFAPISLSIVVGAFIFGIGMQLGDGCASGTLFTVGGGSRRMLITMISFIIGSVLATYHMGFWWNLPSAEAISLIDMLGWGWALLLQLGFLAALFFVLRKWGRGEKPKRQLSWRNILCGPWPLWVGALCLAFLNLATLAVAGHPWSISWGYTLWGGQLAQMLGLDLTHTLFWGSGYQLIALNNSVFDDFTSLMNFGVILGAAIAAGLAQRYFPTFNRRVGQLSSAVIGGLLMGYGARLAFGCNIGAFFSGVISFSLHGWVWILAALPGTWIGVKLRPMFEFRD